MGRDPPLVRQTDNPVAGKDAAETFAESDVSVTHSATRAEGESLELFVGLDNMGGSGTSAPTSDAGVVFSPNQDAPHLSARVHPNNTNVGDVVLYEEETSTQLASTAATAGDTVTFSVTLTAGNSYRLLCTASGSSNLTVEYSSNSPKFGVTYEHGWLGGSSSSNAFRYGFEWVDLLPMSGTATIEWPAPPDVYAWDLAQYLASRDGATVDVFVEEEQAGGWTEIAGPISRGERILASADNNVRYRVELSRADTAANPTLDAIYRRFKL